MGAKEKSIKFANDFAEGAIATDFGKGIISKLTAAGVPIEVIKDGIAEAFIRGYEYRRLEATQEQGAGSIRSLTCANCNNLTADRRMYPHSNGWVVEGHSKKQWVYFHCSSCGYDTSLDYIEIPRDE